MALRAIINALNLILAAHGLIECHMSLSILLKVINLLFFIKEYSFNECLFYHTDQDECAVNIDGCDQNCHNSIGSFFCSCNNGYRLNVDGKTCDG